MSLETNSANEIRANWLELKLIIIDFACKPDPGSGAVRAVECTMGLYGHRFGQLFSQPLKRTVSWNMTKRGHFHSKFYLTTLTFPMNYTFVKTRFIQCENENWRPLDVKKDSLTPNRWIWPCLKPVDIVPSQLWGGGGGSLNPIHECFPRNNILIEKPAVLQELHFLLYILIFKRLHAIEHRYK